MFISPISLRTKHNQNLQQAPQTKSTSKQAFFFLFFFRLTFSGTSPARATYPPLKGSRPHVTNATKHRDLGSRSRVFAKKQTNKTSTRQHIRTSTFTSCVQEFGVFIFTHKFDLLRNKLKLFLAGLSNRAQYMIGAAHALRYRGVAVLLERPAEAMVSGWYAY